MKRAPTPWVEAGRVKTEPFATSWRDGCNGAFLADGLKIIASSGEHWREEGLPRPVWEHVSVSLDGSHETPTWDQMERVRHAFWKPDETVLQLHPPESEYVSQHPGCLHLWRPVGVEIPLPPMITIGTRITGSDAGRRR